MRTYRSSNAENFSDFEVENYRSGLMLQLAGLDPKLIFNCDEVACFYNAGRKDAVRHPEDKYKIENEKKRVTVLPYLSFLDSIRFRPCIITNQKGRHWSSLLSRSQEKVTVNVDGEERSFTRFYCETNKGGIL